MCTCRYSQIRSVIGKKWILKIDIASNGYKYFLYPHVNGAGTDIIVFILVDICTRYTLIH